MYVFYKNQQAVVEINSQWCSSNEADNWLVRSTKVKRSSAIECSMEVHGANLSSSKIVF